MSDRTKPATLARRRSQVYVEIPPSPFTSRSHSPAPPKQSVDLKQNAPFHPLRTNSQANMSTLGSASKKRKMAEDDKSSNLHEDSANTKTKKPKLSAPATQPAGKARTSAKPKATDDQETAETPENLPADEYPNGFFYCHQCTRKRDTSCGIHCTYKHEKSKGQVERCRLKYCKACLKNRYQEDFDEIKSGDPSYLTLKQRAQHVSGQSFYYQCPRCRDECNCRVCRKAKGLEPTGNFNAAARKAAKAEAAAQAQSSSVPSAKSNGKQSGKGTAVTQANGKTAKPRAKPKPKAALPKALPKPLWTRVATDLTMGDAEARMHIREFVVRFSSVLQISHGHLEELDEISGDNLGEIAPWNDEDLGSVELISWVSELCTKAIIQGLLDAVGAYAETRGAHNDSKAIREAIRSVKASGANLSRLWTSLLTLRESLGSDALLTFSDPLPPPAATIIRTTRQNRDSDVVHIANSAQLIPVITDLIEAAIPSPAIRDALEQGPIEEKEYGKLAKEAIAAENNRWKDAKDSKGGKESKQRHQQLIENLESASRLVSLRYSPRFSPLGRDSEGRTYYAVSPGVGESEASINLFRGRDGVVKVGRKRGGFIEEDRREMDRWSWFVAVWGRKPEGADVAKRETSYDDEEDSAMEEDECWWGFWQPQEVMKVAEWLSMEHGLDNASANVSAGIKLNGSSNGSLKINGARSRTSTSSSALSSVPPSHSTSALSDVSDMSDLSDDEDAEGRVNFQISGPNERELRDLVHGLKDYAELLTWRAKRASMEVSDRLQKEKSVPVNRFYA